ncbi:hypothetical protein N9W89_10840 [Hellea sp.]|nr:hypothetical protein [Hellea sp.]
MRSFLTSTLLALSFALATPATAKKFGFDTTITSPLTSAVKVEVVLSEDLAYRANNLPKKLKDRNGTRGLSAGFATNGFFGERDLELLQERLKSDLEKTFSKKGIETSDTSLTIFRVTLDDVTPNRPTFTQRTKQPGLSYNSFAKGGAEIKAELIAPDGRSLGNMSYAWYERDIRFAGLQGTWGDAYDAIQRFSRRAAKSLSTSR